MPVRQRKQVTASTLLPTEERARVVDLIVDLTCTERWMLEGPEGKLPMRRYAENESRLWLRGCHRRQLAHTGISARLEPLTFPDQHEPPLKFWHDVPDDGVL